MNERMKIGFNIALQSTHMTQKRFLVLSLYELKFCMHFSSVSYALYVFPVTYYLILITLCYLAKSTDDEALQYADVPCILLLPPSWIQTFPCTVAYIHDNLKLTQTARFKIINRVMVLKRLNECITDYK
jgi:hypothetical protein